MTPHYYVNVDGGIMTGCFGDVKKFLMNGKLKKVVAVIKSCTSNALGDLTVTLKDLSGTISGVVWAYSCRALSARMKLGDNQLIGPETSMRTTEMIFQIKGSYSRCPEIVRRVMCRKTKNPMSFKYGDKSLLKVSPREGVEVSSDEDVDEWLNEELSKRMTGQDNKEEEDALIDILKIVVEECKSIYRKAQIRTPSSRTSKIQGIYVMADVGAGINMMPKSLFKHLKLAKLKKTNMVIEIVIDTLEKPDETILLGRPFLAMIHAQINVFRGEISLVVGNEKVKFDMNGEICHSMVPLKKIYMASSIQEREYFNPHEMENNDSPALEQRTFHCSKEGVDSIDSSSDSQENKVGSHLSENVSRWHVCKPVHINFKVCEEYYRIRPTCNPDLSFCSGYDAIYGKEENGMLKQWICFRDHETRIEDEDDLEGILDYLKPRSYDGFIDLDDEAYNKKRRDLHKGFLYEEIGIQSLLDSYSCGSKVLSWRNHLGRGSLDLVNLFIRLTLLEPDPLEADWAIISPHISTSILSGSMPDYFSNGHMYPLPWIAVEKVFFRVNEPKKHWCLSELEIRNGVVTFYDSLGLAGVNRRRRWRQMKTLLLEKLTVYLLMHDIFESKGISADDYKITYKSLRRCCYHFKHLGREDCYRKTAVVVIVQLDVNTNTKVDVLVKVDGVLAKKYVSYECGG
ncbi:phospholipase-like protein [Tanacetum coccineum]